MLFRKILKAKPTLPPPEILGVRVRASARARRLSLSVDARTGEVVLTWPRRASARKAEAFVAGNSQWIEKQRAARPPRPAPAPGMRISVLGKVYTAAHVPGRGVSRFEGDTIVVRGDAAHFARRLRDFLKKEAAAALTAAAREKTALLGLPMKDVRVIDPRTRWGSCGTDGRLMFSWRLILAPPFVMDYVVAHEVAHRRHLNHGKRFWALCASLTGDMEGARAWLRREGQGVMACP